MRFGRGAWTYFSDPRSVSDAHATYVGWITPGGWVNVSSHDWTTGQHVVTRLGPRLGKDDHNNPALVLRQDGRITVFYSAHSGPGLNRVRKSRMFYRTTKLPGDVRRWTRPRTVPTNVAGRLGYTYPNPVAIGGDAIWLAWRGGNWLPTGSLLRNGRWSHARNVVRRRGRSRTRVRGSLPMRPYAKYAPAPDGRVHMVYTDGHPYEDRTSLYYVALDPRRGSQRRADGSLLAARRRPVAIRRGERVYAWRRHGNAWAMDVADDGQGRPVIVYTTGWHRKKKVAFRYARWTGTRWQDKFLAWASDAPRAKRRGYGHRFFSGGLTIDHNDPHRFFVSRGVGSRYRVEVWESDANFANWTHRVVSPAGRSCFRPTGSTGYDHRVVLFLCGSHRGWRRFASHVYAAKF